MDGVIDKLVNSDGKVTMKDRQEAVNELGTKIDGGLKMDSAEGIAEFVKLLMWSILDKEITGEEPLDIVKRIIQPKDES